MPNIHIMSTDKPSRLFEILQFNFIFDNQNTYSEEYKKLHGYKNKNIYITNDEEIKEQHLIKEIYVIDIQNGNIGKLTCKNRFFKDSSKLIEIEWKNKQNIWNYNHIREIILTTDQDLIADCVQKIDDEFLEWFVKNPTCEEIEVQKFNGFAEDFLIIIPKEEPKQDKLKELYLKNNPERAAIIEERVNNFIKELKPNQETLKEVAEKYSKKSDASVFQENHKLDFINGAKWQQERSYSEIEDFINWIDEEEIPREEGLWIKYLNGKDTYLTTKQLFEKFKKK